MTRKYEAHTGEWFDMSPLQVLEKINVIKKQLKDLHKKLKAEGRTPDEIKANQECKDLFHAQIRGYKRLKAMNTSTKQLKAEGGERIEKEYWETVNAFKENGPKPENPPVSS